MAGMPRDAVVAVSADAKLTLAETLRADLRPGDVVLIKGSRSMHMEELVDALRTEIAPGAAAKSSGNSERHRCAGRAVGMTDGLLGIVLLTTRGILPAQPRANLAASLGARLGGVRADGDYRSANPRDAKRHKIGKQIRLEGPESHLVKMGTPTMGGIMITTSVVFLTAIFNLAGRLSMLLPIGVVLACAVLGAVDDMINLVGGTRPA